MLDRSEMNAKALRTLRLLGIDGEINPNDIVRSLSVAQQQLVEIAKAVSSEARTLILDEPTAALGQAEIVRLHDLIRRLKQTGHAILYVSHRLDEVVSLIDVATILKDGRRIRAPGQVEIALQPIIAAMIGEDITEHYPPRTHALGEPLFEADRVATSQGVCRCLLGCASGRDIRNRRCHGLGQNLFDARDLRYGSHHRRNHASGQQALQSAFLDRSDRRGCCVDSENRKSDGLFFNFGGAENATIAALDRITHNGILSSRAERNAFAGLMDKLAIHRQATAVKVGGLSGGNQQKIILSRWMFRDAELLLFDEPTQGIDVGAKATIYREMRALCASGKAIIFATSDFEELLGLSDRIAILRNGAITQVAETSSFDEYSLSAAAAGGLAISSSTKE